MLQIGLSTAGKRLSNDLFRQYQEAGIGLMEVSVPYETCVSMNYKQIRNYADTYNVRLWSYHLPFAFSPIDHIDISVEDDEVREDRLDIFSELIKRASDIGIALFVVHPSGEPILDDRRKERMERAKDSLAKLADVTAGCGAVIAVENLPRTCLGRNAVEILELIETDSRLRVCFDTNHLLGEDITDFIRKVGDKIITTHISDYDFINERHWLPGEGEIEWNKVLDAFETVGYCGPWMYEVGFACPKTILRDRDLNCLDFVRNAQEIFERKMPTVFSNRKEKLGMWE